MFASRQLRPVRVAGALLLLAALSCVSTAAAQQIDRADENETAAGRALFEQGMAAVDREDFATAEDRLRRSLELRDSPVVRINLALVLIELGRLVEASEQLRRVQRMEDLDPRAQSLAADRLATIEPLIGELRVDLGGAREGVTVYVDGEPLPEALIGVPHPVDPTLHQVTLRRGDVEIGAESIVVDSGSTSVLDLTARPPTPEEAAAMAVQDDAERRVTVEPGAPAIGGGIETEWWFWTLVGVVVAGAAVGIAVGVVESSGVQAPTLRGDDGRVHMTLLSFP